MFKKGPENREWIHDTHHAPTHVQVNNVVTNVSAVEEKKEHMFCHQIKELSFERATQKIVAEEDEAPTKALTEEECLTLTRLIEKISIRPSDVQIVDVREPRGKITGSKLVFLTYDLGIIVKLGAAGGDIWREICAYCRIMSDYRFLALRKYFPDFLGYVCGPKLDAFALEDLKRKGYVELYDLFQTPTVTQQFNEVNRQAINAISQIHTSTISPNKPNPSAINDIYIRGRFEASVEKIFNEMSKRPNDPVFKAIKKFLKSRRIKIEGENCLGLQLLLKNVRKYSRLLSPTFDVFRQGDFHLKNIFACDETIKIIDLTNSGYNHDAVYDLGKYIHFPLQFYPLQLLQDKHLGIKVEDFQLDYDTNSGIPEISYNTANFIPRGVEKVVEAVPENHFLFSGNMKKADEAAPGRLVLAVSASTIGGIKYLPPQLSLICIGESLKTLNSLKIILEEKKMNDLDFCLDKLINGWR